MHRHQHQHRGWHAAPPHSYSYNMAYYPNTTPNAVCPNALRSSNPFDVADEPPQGGFHHMLATLSTPSLGDRPLGLRPPQIPPHMPSGTFSYGILLSRSHLHGARRIRRHEPKTSR